MCLLVGSLFPLGDASAADSDSFLSEQSRWVISFPAWTLCKLMLTILRWNYSGIRKSQNVTRAWLEEQLSRGMKLCFLLAWNFTTLSGLHFSFHNSFCAAENQHLEVFNNSQTQQYPALTITPPLENSASVKSTLLKTISLYSPEDAGEESPLLLLAVNQKRCRQQVTN